MAQFLLTYLEQPQMGSPEDGKAHMGKWMDWLASGGGCGLSRCSGETLQGGWPGWA